MSIWQLRPLAWMSLLALVLATPSLAATTDVDGEVFSLGEVIVTGEDQVVNLATTVTEVTAEDMKQRGARTLAEALELLPGVDVQRGSKKNESFVQIRGFSDQDVKILIDGVPVYEQYSRQLDLSQIPTSSIAKITVTKGASSVLYGANTLGGVINIITKKAGSKPTATATVARGDYDTEEYSLGLGAPIGKFNYWLGYSYLHSDGWRLSRKFDEEWWKGADDGGKRNNSDYLQHTFNAKLGFEPNPDDSLYLTFDYHDNEKGVPTRGWFYPEWQQWHVNLIGQKKVTDWWKIKARAFYADHDDTLFMTATKKSPATFSAYDNYSVGGSLHNFLDFGHWSFLKVGVSFQRDNSEQSEKIPPAGAWTDAGEFEADTYTFAVEDEIKPFDWLAFVFGASYDYYDPRKAGDRPVPDSIDSFNPQAGVVITLAEATALHGSVGKKIRFPHLKELFSDMAGGNPDLNPQKTISYEVGLTQAFGDSVTLTVAAFYNDIDNLIEKIDVFDPVEGEDVPAYFNVGEAVTKGMEVSLGADITDSFWAGINYTYMRTEDKDQDRELEGRPRHRANLDARYRFPFGLTTAAQLSYTNRQFYDDKDKGWTRSPDFLLLNTRVEQRLGEIWGVEGRAFVEVTNLTDRDYYEVGQPAPGRNFLAGLNFTY